MAKVRSTTSSFRVGDRVRVPFGRGTADAVILEDRGPIGWKGRHLFMIQIPMDPKDAADPLTFEVPEEEMEVADRRADESRRIDKRKVIEYLKQGGLVEILGSNLSDGCSHWRVWLWIDGLGNINHTFIAERGVIGGGRIPSWAIHEDKIFAPKADEVRAFLKSFGLSDEEAARVIDHIGTVP